MGGGEAVKDILAKNLVILASAGSGKTYQLGNRVIGKIGLEGVDPERIVALTFTRKAAGEFADSVLMKLATASLDPVQAADICEEVGGELNLPQVLESVVRALPRMQLTTQDAFFSQIVRGFQYELGLTGGVFDLLEGEALETAKREILDGILREGFENREALFHAYRRASLGKGQAGVQQSLEKFVGIWHRTWKEGARLEHFGNEEVFGQLGSVDDWLAGKDALIASLREEFDNAAWQKVLDDLEDHRVGNAPSLNALGKRLLARIGEADPIEEKDRGKVLAFSEAGWRNFQDLVGLAIRSELASAVEKTQAVGEIIAQVDQEHARQLRRKGLLSFDDVKLLLGQWNSSEEARLRREMIDYRLDGRYDHWLLDEFQDTSREEWQALKPLMDEAISGDEGSFFVVGDRKQGIYAWRGGDVALFGEILEHYGKALTVAPMDVSFRSCPAVLALVNAVCGNLEVIERLFGKAVSEQWTWTDHVSAKPEVTGEAKVVEVTKDEADQILVDELHRLGIGKKKLTCGVLVRQGSEVKYYAELLRASGFEVIEAGERTPGGEHAVGVAIENLIHWLADPANGMCRGILEMSPLMDGLARYGEGWGTRWDRIIREVQVSGYARFVSALVAPEWNDLGLYGRRRAEDLIASLAEFDRRGEGCPRAAWRWVENLKVPAAPGTAAIQVMTIHKSKGLGFDVVMLPEFSDREQVPNSRYFDISRGENWVLQNPGKWAYEAFPETREAFERWSETQKYEALCLAYVALTRAKRGLYVYLPEEPKSRRDKESFASLGNLVRQSTGSEFPESDPDWTASVGESEEKLARVLPVLPEGRPQRSRTSPSRLKGEIESNGGSGRRIGQEVHQLFEKIAWLKPGEIPSQPYSAAGKIVEDALAVPAIFSVFEDDGGELFREQGFELIHQGKWLSGVVDRMVVSRKDGRVESVEVVDFKTDTVKNEGELRERYAGQILGYQVAIAKVFGIATGQVRCRLVSTHLGAVFDATVDDAQGELGL